jgi:hypothetical protein
VFGNPIATFANELPYTSTISFPFAHSQRVTKFVD